MEKKPEIFSITEMFSMQPNSYYVGGVNQSLIKIHKIVEEMVYITGDGYEYYVGYDEYGNRLFEYKKGTVNVHYKK